MNAPKFTSVFAPQLQRFLAFKASMGFSCSSRDWYLTSFDRYCTNHRLQHFDRSTVEGWVLSMQSAQPNSCWSWMSYIRDFGRWIRLNGLDNAYVLSDQWKPKRIRPQPYLLAQEEVSRFFDAAAELKTGTPWQWQAVAFFALMHSCGLRTGEVRRLTPGDVNLADGFIDVYWSKGNRTRRLPITDQIVRVLTDADRALGAQRDAFFISSRGNSVSASTIATIFHTIWDHAGLPRPVEGKQPRPYDFRHHFAYANIERWMAQGTDVNAMLPYLARYMGHASFQSTYYYIHTSPDFMSGYAQITREIQAILPEVGFQ